jgi:hypothetical protein
MKTALTVFRIIKDRGLTVRVIADREPPDMQHRREEIISTRIF